MTTTKNIPANVNVDDWREKITTITSKRADVLYGDSLHGAPTAIVFEQDLTTEESAAYDALAAAETVQANAKVQAQNIPNWASWTEAEALAWHDANIANALPVANLSSANTVLARLEQENRALIRMVIALRNQAWSDLQDG